MFAGWFRVTNRKTIQVKKNLIDRAIEVVAPVAAAKRMHARMVMAMAGGYTGASRNRRSTQDWQTYGDDANAALLPDLVMLRNRSSDLLRNNPLAVGAINTKVTSIIGTGLKVQSLIDSEFLGLTEEQASAWQKAAEREFWFWSSRECDLERTLNFPAMQELALRSCFEKGDVFGLLPMVSRPGSAYETKIQLIESERVSNKDWAQDTVSAAGGIVRDEYGAPKSCWITAEHPGAHYGRGNLTWKEYPFFDNNGLPVVIHVYRKLRPGQSRGVPDLAPVIESLKQLGRYTEAELMAAVVSGMFTVFIKTESGEAELSNLPGVGSSSQDRASSADDLSLGNGAIVGLAEGESIESANPGRPNAAFDPFVLAIIRQVGVALELPYELMIKHFTASYSASRAALLEAWRSFKARRQWFAAQFCQPCYEAVIAEAIMKGRLSAPGFMTDPRVRAAYLGSEWVGDPMGQLNPVAETKAAEDRIRIGISSHEREAMEQTGSDYQDLHKANKRVFSERIADGLPVPGIDRAPVAAPEQPEE